VSENDDQVRLHPRRRKVLVVDDHPLVVEGIRRALEASDDFEVVGEVHNGTQVLSMIKTTSPDIVLLDLRLPGMDGLTCMTRIQQHHPGIKVVVMSVFFDREHIDAALQRGACSYIVKSINPADLPSALRQAADETVFHALGLPQEEHGSPGKAAGLTERETAILNGVARGLSNQAIGKELWVTEQTVKFHLTNIYRKLGVANRTEAARYAYQHGLAEAHLP
jgi:DNA-binding NarL/FixJ family response regulator